MKSYNILVDKPTMLEGSTQVTATSWEIRSTPDTESKTNLIHHSYKNATNLFQYRINLDLTDEDCIKFISSTIQKPYKSYNRDGNRKIRHNKKNYIANELE